MTKNSSWFATTKDLTNLIIESDFSGLDFKLLFFLLDNMNPYNKITNFRNKEIAILFEKSVQSMSTSMSKLRANNLLKRTGKPYEIMINPHYFYNGGKVSKKYKIDEYDNLK